MTRDTVKQTQPTLHLTITVSQPVYEAIQSPITTINNIAPTHNPLQLWMVHNEKTPLLSAKPILPSSPPMETIIPIKSPSPPIETIIPITSPTPDLPERQSSHEYLVPSDNEPLEESLWKIAIQIFIPFIISGLGTVGAGIFLNIVQEYEVFEVVPEMFVLVPALLGLNGNVQMTLASRVATQANLGLIDDHREQWKIAFGNLSLLQCQSTILGLVASLLAFFVSWTREGEFNVHNFLLLTSSSLLTAAFASFLLGSLTIFIVICSRKLNINPDNIAAPLSSALGDIGTLALLATIASFQFSLVAHNDDYVWIETIVVITLLSLIPMWAILAYKCPFTQQVLYSGWIPVISAVAISSVGGYILNLAVAHYKKIAACQPVISGVGGNLVAVQACRISTDLHQRSKPGLMPKSDKDGNDEYSLCVSPCVAWFGKHPHAKTAKLLILMAIPGHLLFITMVHLLSQDSPMTFQFLSLYLFSALIEVALLLYLAHCIVHWLWNFGINPDDAAIPYLTATGDLLGTGFLFIAFLTLDILP